MKTLDLDAIPERPTSPQERAAAVRQIIGALIADQHRHVALAAAPLLATMKRIETMNAAA